MAAQQNGPATGTMDTATTAHVRARSTVRKANQCSLRHTDGQPRHRHRQTAGRPATPCDRTLHLLRLRAGDLDVEREDEGVGGGAKHDVIAAHVTRTCH